MIVGKNEVVGLFPTINSSRGRAAANPVSGLSEAGYFSASQSGALKNLKRSAQTGREGARLTRLLLFSKGRVFFLAVQSFQKSKAFDRATAQIRHNNGTNKPIVGCITFVFENSCRCIFLLERGIEPFHVRSLCLRINTAISIYTALHSTEHIRHTSTSVIPADRLARHAEP